MDGIKELFECNKETMSAEVRAHIWAMVCEIAKERYDFEFGKVCKDRPSWSFAYTRQRALENARKSVMVSAGIPVDFFG
jgi:hypothetical protein